MANRKRTIKLEFRVMESEAEIIRHKMNQCGTVNREAFLRKMALDGYVLKMDLPELKEILSLLRRSSNNLNQLTRRVHEIGRIYDTDLEDIAQRQDEISQRVKEIVVRLSKITNSDITSPRERERTVQENA